MVTTEAEPVRCLRSDARENRDRILAAAAQAFADDGLGVSLIEIARRAGVGNATLHRNFTKQQLVEELFQDWLARREAVAARAMAEPDPWHGLVSFLEDVLADGTRNRAIGPLFAICPGWRLRFRAMISDLLARAQNAGSARADLTVEDIVLALLGVARTMAITGNISPGQWRRHLAIVLDGMKAQHTQRLPGLPPVPAQLDSDLREWSCRMLRNGAEDAGPDTRPDTRQQAARQLE
jgi:AcrR family transcriptional regulator